MTDVQRPPDLDLSRVKHQVEYVVGVANRVVGLTLTIGGLALAVNWRIRFGGFGALKAFYLYTAWAFGALELLASVGMLRRWPVRWVLQMLPLVVPVIAYQYFILHFIFRRI